MNSLPEHVNEAVANVILTVKGQEQRQTAFLFTDDGHLLTSGHGFHRGKYKIGSRFLIRFSETDEKGKEIGDAFEGILVEFKFQPARGIDFAILQIKDDEFQKTKRRKLRIREYERIKGRPTKFIGTGYAHDFHIASKYVWDGKIVPPVKITEAPWWMQLNMSNRKDLRGASGSPIFVNQHVVAVQANQDNDTRAQAFVLHRQQSDILKRELQNEWDRFYFSETIFKNHNLQILKPNDKSNPFKAHDTRYLLFLYDTVVIEQVRLYGSIAHVQPLERLANELLIKIKNIRNSRKINISRVQNTQFDFVSLNDSIRIFAEVEGHPNINEHLRIIIDLGSGLSDNAGDGWLERRAVDMSHHVLVKVNFNKRNTIEIYSDNNHHLIFEINNENEEYITKVIQNIIVDTLLDICYFYSIPALTSTFLEIAEKQSFSKRKVQYCLERGLNIYSNLLDENLEYVSIAYTCRKRADGEINIKQYLDTWSDLLGGPEGIFYSIDELLNGLDEETIVRRLLSIPKLSGQFSEELLRKKFRSFKQKKTNELVIFAVLSKSPQAGEIASMETIFTSEKLHSFEFLPISQLSLIARFSHLMKLFFFVKK